MAKRQYRNHLNNLTNKDWLIFQKSWFIHNPPPRKKDVRRHPAKFPESLAQEFIEFFTKQGGRILDPMAGTGSTLVAALRAGRHSYGFELNSGYTNIAKDVIKAEKDRLGSTISHLDARIITGDAKDAAQLFQDHDIPEIDYMITSPPYWDMLHARGARNQMIRRDDSELDVIYSNNPSDLGNIHDYGSFLDQLVMIYQNLKPYLRDRAYLTIIVKNVKKGGQIYPLAWDLASRLRDSYTLKDEKIWCQDNQRLSPYGMGNAWVSNTFHHYCLQFRNE